MPRETPEWIGATPDTLVPDRVKVRVFEAYDGRCHWTGRKIMPGDEWDTDHVIALINGGENRETNLAPILRGKPHRDKTAKDVKQKAAGYRKKKRHLGLHKPKHVMPGSRADWRARRWSKEEGRFVTVNRRTGERL